MKIGTTTIPFLPLAAVVLAMLLVVLVLWGVRRARRHPAPAAVPGARPARAPEPAPQPCAADWTGEVANGYVPAPVPVERPRTVADIVAERGADTSPLPVVAAVPAAAPSPVPRTGAHARSDVVEEPVPGPAPRGDAEAAPRTAPGAGANRLRIDPATLDAMADADARAAAADDTRHTAADDTRHTAADDTRHTAAGDTRHTAAGDTRHTAAAAPPADATPAAHGPTTAEDRAPGGQTPGSTADAARDVSAPSDERPDPATLAALHTPAGDAHAPPAHADDDTSAAEQARPAPADLDPAHEQTPDPAHETVLPPWSAARSEPVGTGLEPSDDESGADPASAGAAERDTDPAAEPVSRAVQQALAARAVQRARRQRDDGGQDDASPEPVEPSEQTREHPLTVVPSASAPVATADPRDRLLSVLLVDPARAVGATEDLDDARDRIDQLGDVLRRRRADLAVAVRRLHDSGLDREQIGRLAGMGHDDVTAILETRTGDGADGPRHA